MHRNASLHRIAIRRHKSAVFFEGFLIFWFSIEIPIFQYLCEFKRTNIKPHEFEWNVRVSNTNTLSNWQVINIRGILFITHSRFNFIAMFCQIVLFVVFISLSFFIVLSDSHNIQYAGGVVARVLFRVLCLLLAMCIYF